MKKGQKNVKKDKRKLRKQTNLHIDPLNKFFRKKWSPKADNRPVQITRPTDVARAFQVGIAEVLLKIEVLGVKGVSRTTKLSREIIDRILREGKDPHFWPTIISKEKRKAADPESVGYEGKFKRPRHLVSKKSRRRKGKSSTPPPPISTPVGGQPGYRRKRQYI